MALRWTEFPETFIPPVGWTVREFSRIAAVIAGQSPSSDECNDAGDGLPFLQGNAEFGDHYPSPESWCTKAPKVAPRGSILISVRAPVGEINLADQEYAIGRGLASIQTISISARFLYQALQRWKIALQRVGQGTTFDAVTAKHFRQLQVAVPPPEEQQVIASILDRADAAIEHARDELRQARRLRQGLLQALVMRGVTADGRVRDPAEFSFASSEVGTFPSEWKIVRLAEAATVGSGVTLGKDLTGQPTIELPYLRVANVQAGFLNLDEIKTVRVRPDEVENFRLEPGDIVMTEGGDIDKLGRGAIWPGVIEPCLHQNHIFRVRAIRERLDPRFLEAVICSDIGRRYFFRIAKRTTNLASINKTQLKAFRLPLPPIFEQERIAAALEKADEQLSAIAAKEALLVKLKRGLMHDLLTGKVRVPATLEVARP